MPAEFINITTSMFFDKPGVMRHVKDGTESSLAKMGAYVRQSAKSSIRPAVKLPKSKKKTARYLAGQTGIPGGPPRSHTGRLRDLIFFGYDENANGGMGGGVVGPLLWKTQSPTVPHTLEFGGPGIGSKGQPAVYKKFPFMAPALEANADKFARMFAGAVHG
jgi:hypothetical protein